MTMLIRDSRIPKGLASHPYRVDRMNELPPELREIALSTLPPGEKVYTSIVVPFSSFIDHAQGHRRYEPEQALLFTQHGVLHVQTSGPHKPYFQSRFLFAQDLLMMNQSLILLYGRLELTGMMNGQLDKILLEYNSISHHLMQPAIQTFLHESWAKSTRTAIGSHIEESVCHELNKLPVKFQNGLRNYALQPEEHLLAVVFQPAIRERTWLGISRQISSPTVLALTDRRVISVSEEKAPHSDESGWVYTFLPRQAIQTIEIHPTRNHEIFTFWLSKENIQSHWNVLLSRPIATDWQVLWDCYGDTTVRGGCS